VSEERGIRDLRQKKGKKKRGFSARRWDMKKKKIHPSRKRKKWSDERLSPREEEEEEDGWS